MPRSALVQGLLDKGEDELEKLSKAFKKREVAISSSPWLEKRAGCNVQLQKEEESGYYFTTNIQLQRSVI